MRVHRKAHERLSVAYSAVRRCRRLSFPQEAPVRHSIIGRVLRDADRRNSTLVADGRIMCRSRFPDRTAARRCAHSTQNDPTLIAVRAAARPMGRAADHAGYRAYAMELSAAKRREARDRPVKTAIREHHRRTHIL